MPREIRTYSDELKAQVIADIEGGGKLRTVARLHDVPHSTVRSWLGKIDNYSPVARSTPEIRQAAANAIIGLAAAIVDTTSAILRETRDPTWIKAQNAHDLGVFIGIIVDKAATIYSAVERGEALRDAEYAAGAGATARELAGSPGDTRL